MTDEQREAFQGAILDKALYSPSEVAYRLDISRTSVYNLIRAGRLRSVKFGSHTKILGASLQEFLDSLTETS